MANYEFPKVPWKRFWEGWKWDQIRGAVRVLGYWAVGLDRINKDSFQGRIVAVCVGRKERSTGFAKSNS